MNVAPLTSTTGYRGIVAACREVRETPAAPLPWRQAAAAACEMRWMFPGRAFTPGSTAAPALVHGDDVLVTAIDSSFESSDRSASGPGW
jgi:hypothetical protein